MSAVVNTYLQFEARESLVRHISVAYVAAKAEGETNTFLCMAYIHWLRAFPEDALDGLVALPKHHGHRAPEPVVPEGSPTFLDVVEATLIYHRLVSVHPISVSTALTTLISSHIPRSSINFGTFVNQPCLIESNNS